MVFVWLMILISIILMLFSSKFSGLSKFVKSYGGVITEKNIILNTDVSFAVNV